MVRIADLVEAGNGGTRGNSHILGTVLGDPYLYDNNVVFRNVRDATLSLGYIFDDSPCELNNLYQAFSLASLQWILEAGRIPYIDNVSVLVRLIDRNPQLEVPPQLLLRVFRRNYLLHESSHAVAHRVLCSAAHPLLESLPHDEAFVFNALLSESFANTVERIGSALAASSLHALLFSLNSYIPFNRAQNEAIRTSLNSSGLRTVFRLGFVLYYYSNVGADPLLLGMSDELLAGIVAEAPIGDCASILLVEQLAEAGFRVNPGFREETTPVFFDLHSCSVAYKKVLGYSPNLTLTALLYFARVFSEIAVTGFSGATERSA